MYGKLPIHSLLTVAPLVAVKISSLALFIRTIPYFQIVKRKGGFRERVKKISTTVQKGVRRSPRLTKCKLQYFF